MGAILTYAFTTFQNDVHGVAVASRWPNASFTWVLNDTGTAPARVDVSDGTDPLPIKTVLANSFSAWAAASLNGQQLTGISIANGTDVLQRCLLRRSIARTSFRLMTPVPLTFPPEPPRLL